jgi:hypothetical protein
MWRTLNYVNFPSVFLWLSAVFINNENALTDAVIANNNVDGCDSFYSYEVVRGSPVEC